MTDFDQLRAWAQAAQEGDASAYRALLEGLLPYTRAVVTRRIGVNADVEDIVQECLLGVHKSLHTYRPAKSLKPWVNAIIGYKTVDYFRRCSRTQEFAVGDAIEVTDLSPEANTQGEDDVTDAASVWELVAMLPAPMRDAVTLTHREGLSTQEAAARLNISEAALRKRVSRAYRKLAHRMERMGMR